MKLSESTSISSVEMARGKWYLVPYVSGNHIGERDGIIYQDGYIASFQGFLLATAFGFAVTLSAWVHVSPTGFTLADQDLCVAVYMLSCCILVLVMYKMKMGQEIVQDAPRSESSSIAHKIRHIIKDQLVLIGIVFFYVLSVFMDALTIIAYAVCLSEEAAHHQDRIYSYSCIIVNRLLKIISMAFLVSFAVTFRHTRFVRHLVTVRYILMFLLSATLIMWLDNFAHDFKHGFHGEDPVENMCINRTKLSFVFSPKMVTEKVDDIFGVLPVISPYFYPVNIEFALLVLEIVAHLFFSIHLARSNDSPVEAPSPALTDESDSSHNNGEPQDQVVLDSSVEVRIPDATTESEQGDGTQHVQDGPLLPAEADEPEAAGPSSQVTEVIASEEGGEPEDQDGDSEHDETELKVEDADQAHDSGNDPHNVNDRTPLLAPHESSVNRGNDVVIEVPPQDQLIEAEQFWPRIYSQLTIFFTAIISVVINVLYILLALLTSYQLVNDEETFLCVYHGLNLFLNFAQVIAIYIALYHCETFQSRYKPFSGLEMLVVLSSGGSYLNIFLTLMAIADTVHPGDTTNAIYFARQFVHAMSIYVQTAFMLNVSRVEAPEHSHRQKTIVKQVLLFSAVCNISIWIFDSFISFNDHHMQDSVQQQYFGDAWMIIAHTIQPFRIFYRFNSFFMLFGGFLDF